MVTLNQTQDTSFQINCISICPYEGTARQAIRSFKYQNKHELAGDLAEALVNGLYPILQHINEPAETSKLNANPNTRKNRSLEAKSNFVLIAVPLHQTKLEERGFNQSELITLALSKRTGIKCDTKTLVRARATTPQYGLTKGERAINVSSAFRANHRVKGKQVILVDDVLTSGATALACAQALIEAGAESVSVLTVARALLRSEQNLQSKNLLAEANSTLTT